MSSRWLIGIAAVVAALVIVAVVLGVVSTGATTFDESTPAGVVQRFLQALERDDAQAAYAYFSKPVQDKCKYEDFRTTLMQVRPHMEDSRVTLEKTRITDDRAEVTVTISGFTGPRGPVPPIPPFPDDFEDSFEHTFLLQRQNEQWRLSQVSWPVWFCPEPRPAKEPALAP